MPSSVEPLPSWGILVLQGAARAWVIFAIVWGSILFVGQNIVQNVLTGHRHTTSGQPTTVNGDTSSPTYAIGPAGADH
jgi:hypothetical protein